MVPLKKIIYELLLFAIVHLSATNDILFNHNHYDKNPWVHMDIIGVNLYVKTSKQYSLQEINTSLYCSRMKHKYMIQYKGLVLLYLLNIS